MTMLRSLAILTIIQLCLLHQAVAIVLDEALLITSQGLGHMLYLNCVLAPPITEEQVAYCATLKLSYLASLHVLNQPFGLSLAASPDPYIPNPFSPCIYEIAYLIIPDICIGA